MALDPAAVVDDDWLAPPIPTTAFNESVACWNPSSEADWVLLLMDDWVVGLDSRVDRSIGWEYVDVGPEPSPGPPPILLTTGIIPEVAAPAEVPTGAPGAAAATTAADVGCTPLAALDAALPPSTADEKLLF